MKCGGARGGVENSALRIKRHSRPIVRGAAGLPCILWPSVRGKFARMRDGVKRTAQLSGSNVVGANVAGRRGKSLGIAAADDDQIFVNDGWAGQVNGLSGGGFAAKVFTEVDEAFLCKSRNGFAGGSVQSVEEIHHANQNALVLAVGPVGETAVRLRAANARVELPEELAVRGIQGENFLRSCDSLEHALDDDRAR